MDAESAFHSARKILDAKLLSSDFSMEQLLAIKAAVPAMDLPQYEKEIVIARMDHQLVRYDSIVFQE